MLAPRRAAPNINADRTMLVEAVPRMRSERRTVVAGDRPEKLRLDRRPEMARYFPDKTQKLEIP